MFTRVSDRPGGLAALLVQVAGAQANIIDVEHVRDRVPLAVRETGVEFTVETRGPNHLASVLAELRGAGFDVTEIAIG